MENDDIKLIRRTLSGDEVAFSELVNKYQKSVHALAWRKIGDFHIAEEITQDTFLLAYKSLVEKSKSVCRLALRHYRSAMQSVVPKEANGHAIPECHQ